MRLALPKAAALVAALVSAGAISRGTEVRPPAESLPDRLTSAEFWALSAALSEPAGYFRSENLVSNEHTYQFVVPALVEAVRPGGVYLGVAPDQNFTYIAAVRPRLVFILDIRRGNLLQHLLYKALFELSNDRADFVSRLFSKPRPDGLGPSSGVNDIFNAFARVRTSEGLYRRNLAAVRTQLTGRHAFPLTDEDLQQLESIYFAFFWEGPSLRYSMGPGWGLRGVRTSFPTFEEQATQTDWTGRQRGYLASEAHFRLVRDLQRRNLVVPVVGNFAGPRALRAIGAWIRERGATVSAFYVSNVEQYLFQDGLFEPFARNVATLPVSESSTFIRSVSSRFGYQGSYQWRDGRASALYPIRTFVRDFELGLLESYYDLNARSR
jgi:hypothetical protein